MKKIITLIGAVATLGLVGCSKTSSSVDFSALQEDKTTTFIVEVDDNLDSKTNGKARNRALSDVKFKLTGFDYSVPYVYDRVLNGFAITVNSKQASLCEAVLKSSNYGFISYVLSLLKIVITQSSTKKITCSKSEKGKR